MQSASEVHGSSPAAGRKIRILCVDDHSIVREGIALIVNRQPDMEVVASAATVPEAIAKFVEHRPDVTLMDLRLRGAGDLFGTRQHGAPAFVAARFPDDLPVLLRARAAARRVLADPRADRDPALARLSLRVAAREALAGDVAAGG